jgi:hypothetical protein
MTKLLKRIFHGTWMSGHIRLGPITVFGRNAMHWGVDIKFRRGYLCFRLPLPCFGAWWPLYLYWSPDATPSRATWGIYGRRLLPEEAQG